MMRSFFRVAPVLPLALGITGLAACPGLINDPSWLSDAGIPSPRAPDARPPTMMVDAAPVPPPTPDGGASSDATAASRPDAPTAAEGWCSDSVEITARILQPKCGTCHGSATKAGGLDLVSPGGRARLVDVPSTMCRDQALVELTPSVGGHLFRKLENAVDGCGERMPAGGVPWLNATEIQCLKNWINPPQPQP